LGEGVSGSGDPLESDEEDLEEDEQGDTKAKKRNKPQQVTDLEDIKMNSGNNTASGSPLPVDFTTGGKAAAPSENNAKEM
ncbi:hypothetical protein PHISCL_11173, partial [Aspergillus sclerotialis]